MNKVVKSDDEWRALLTAEEFEITRKAGTERAFTGIYNDCKTPGIYNCKCCDTPLFDAATKYDSGSGWPSFTRPVDESHIDEAADNSLGRQRTEVLCARCDAHLGHVFEDGPDENGLRYCINSASLDFVPDDSSEN